MSSSTDRRRHILAASRTEVDSLAGQSVSEVTPSRRDFAHYVATQKQELAVIARLTPAMRATLVAHARACDDAEVAALAVATEPDGLSVDEMFAVAAATTAPILREHLLIDPRQLYHARLHGADAVMVPAADLDPSLLHELVTVANSLHMATVVEVSDRAAVAAALRLPHTIIGLNCIGDDGGLDLPQTLQLLAAIPRQRTVIMLPEIRSAAECGALRGLCDAIVVGKLLVGVDDLAALLQTLT